MDLGAEKRFRNIWVVTGWQNGEVSVAEQFEVQVKTDDEWRTLPGGEIHGNKQSRREVNLEEPITAQFIRVRFESGDYFRVYEIAVFQERPEIAEAGAANYGLARVCREVATERDLLNLRGTFYELPARNAQGLAKVRPVATHNLAIHDFCSHNGLLLFTGIDAET